MNHPFIPVSEPVIGELEEELVLDCLRTGWLSSEGKYVREFETACAAYSGMDEGVSVCNGTAALKVSVACLPLEAGDEIIMPSFTIISCAIAILEAGAVPVLVDCDPVTWTMNVADIEAQITPKTRAIMAVHIYGHPVDMDPVLEIAEKYRLWVIEDAAESHGGEYKGRKCGGLGDIGILSFYANKMVTTGEGGMVMTSHPKFAKRARSLRNMCFREGERFSHTEIGHNYRLSNIQAAVGLGQLKQIETFVRRKREMAEIYECKLKKLPLHLPVEKEWARNVYWMYGIVLHESVEMDAHEFARMLMKRGIQTRPFFMGMHEQPVFRDMGLFKNTNCPEAERLYRKGLYLPSGQAITDRQIKQVCDAIYSIFDGIRGSW